MRFPGEVLAQIYQAAPGPVTIEWPKGAGQPVKGRRYYMQKADESEPKAESKPAELKPLPEHMQNHSEVMAAMRARLNGEPEPPPQPGRVEELKVAAKRPTKTTPKLEVEAVHVQPVGWRATVKLVTDPSHGMHIKARVHGSVAKNALGTITTTRPSDESAGEFYQPPEYEPAQTLDDYTHTRLFQFADQERVLAQAVSEERQKQAATKAEIERCRLNGEPTSMAESRLERSEKRLAELAPERLMDGLELRTA